MIGLVEKSASNMAIYSIYVKFMGCMFFLIQHTSATRQIMATISPPVGISPGGGGSGNSSNCHFFRCRNYPISSMYGIFTYIYHTNI